LLRAIGGMACSVSGEPIKFPYIEWQEPETSLDGQLVDEDGLLGMGMFGMGMSDEERKKEREERREKERLEREMRK